MENEKLKYPQLDGRHALRCNKHPGRKLELDGYANYYSAVYKCSKKGCDFSIILTIAEEFQDREVAEYIEKHQKEAGKNG